MYTFSSEVVKIRKAELRMNEQVKYDVIKKLVETNGNKKRYIQDMSHPWKKDNFMKYVYAMVGHETDRAC